MSTSWRGTVNVVDLMKVGERRRVVEVYARFEVLVDGQKAASYPARLVYPAREFRNLTVLQAWRKIRDGQILGVPGLLDMGTKLLQDWEDGETIRSISPGFVFGPS